MKTNRGITIRAQDLRLNYGQFEALNIPELNISGNVFAIVGHNGSGKSTFIKTLLNLLQPKSGTLIALSDEDSLDIFRPENDMAFSPEEGAVFEDLTVESYIKLWCCLKYNQKKFYKLNGDSIIKKFHIDVLFKKLGRELSKGQRRRVQTAIGFLTNPKLFLFDEPFDGLDVEQSRRLAGILKEESQMRAIFISSHQMEIVERLADQVIVLDDGKIIATGTPKQVAAELCGSCYVIRAGEQDPKVLDLFRDEFDLILSYSVPGGVIVCGHEVSNSFLNKTLTTGHVFEYKVEQITVSLVDAMHYHLRSREKHISLLQQNTDSY